MKKDFWRAAKLLLSQLLSLNINEQLVREVDCLTADNQVLKNQITTNGRRLKFIDEQRRLLVYKAYIAHFHRERNHQGLDNTIPFPSKTVGKESGKIRKKERLGGLLKYYYRQAA